MIEKILEMKGMGRMIVKEIMEREMKVVKGKMMLIGLILVEINVMVEIIYKIDDKRVRYEWDGKKELIIDEGYRKEKSCDERKKNDEEKIIKNRNGNYDDSGYGRSYRKMDKKWKEKREISEDEV